MLRASVGVPVTVTGSVKLTWMLMVWPALYTPSAVEAVTPLTVGGVVSTTMALLAPSEFVAPGVARARVAGLPAGSRMVPLLRVSAAVSW